MMNIPKKTLSTLTGVGLVLAMSACTLDSPEINDAPPASETSAPVEETSEKVPDGVGSFGQVVSWDGVDVTVGKPKPFEPSATAAGADQFPDTLAFDIKLTNTGDEPFDPNLAYVTASSAEQEASSVFDSEKGVNGPPQTPVMPGKSAKWTVVFNVADASDVVLQLTPDMLMEPVLFSTGS